MALAVTNVSPHPTQLLSHPCYHYNVFTLEHLVALGTYLFNRWTYSENIRSVPGACVCHLSCLGGCGRRITAAWKFKVWVGNKGDIFSKQTNKQTSPSKSLSFSRKAETLSELSFLVLLLHSTPLQTPSLWFHLRSPSFLALPCFMNTQSFLQRQDLSTYSSHICTPLTSFF